MLPTIGDDIDKLTRPFIMERLKSRNVNLISNAKIIEVIKDGVLYEKDQTNIILNGVDSLILALGYESYNPLELSLKCLVDKLYVIGDAVQAQKL